MVTTPRRSRSARSSRCTSCWAKPGCHLPFRGCGLESETRRAFADFVLYASWGAVILEVDENQHRERDPSCDVRRDFDMAASVALGSARKLAIVRYNPDPFKVAGRTVRTPKEGAPGPPPAAAGAPVPAPFPVLRQGGRGQRAARRGGGLGRGRPDGVAGGGVKSHVTVCKLHHRQGTRLWQHARRDHRTTGSHGGAGRHDFDPVHPAGDHRSQHCKHWRERCRPGCAANPSGRPARTARPHTLRFGRRLGRRQRQHSSESVQPHGLERQPHNRLAPSPIN